MIKFLLVVLLLPTLSMAATGLPNATLTPGATNQKVTTQSMMSTICVKGWSATIRPTTQYTNQLKRKQIKQYGYTDTDPKQYEEDHLIPLSIGGHPTDAKNLWPEPRSGEWSAEVKDQLEDVIHRLVCTGKVPLKRAQEEMASNWIEAYKKYVAAQPRVKHASLEFGGNNGGRIQR